MNKIILSEEEKKTGKFNLSNLIQHYNINMILCNNITSMNINCISCPKYIDDDDIEKWINEYNSELIDDYDIETFNDLTDDDIETMENANRMNLVTMGLACNWMPKSIDEIRNFRIYGDYPTIGNDGFEDLLITAKNGSMDMEFFTMDYIGNNKFLLRTKSVLNQSNVLNQKYIDIKANKETLVRKLFKNKNN